MKSNIGHTQAAAGVAGVIMGLRDAAGPEGAPDAGEGGRPTARRRRHCRTAPW
ncbi:hypothetical protein AB0G54_39235 [Streptomyces yokosukanensis]|uniref:hypothetical protein n=1 Tax=Streptomyces yokosukanensis TaxID=67386 RepID=UPI003418E1AA